MLRPNVHVTKSGPGVKRLEERLSALQASRVLVGIPAEENNRGGNMLDRAANMPLSPSGKTSKKAMDLAKRAAEQSIGNAALLFIHTNGSQARGIPKRPVIEPAIQFEPNRRAITAVLKLAAQAELEGKHDEAIEQLRRAGLLGSNAAKRWFTNPANGWPPNKRATVLRKLRKLSGKRYRAARAAYDAGNWQEVDTPLVDTGEMRRAITYVVETGQESMPAAPAEGVASEPEALP